MNLDGPTPGVTHLLAPARVGGLETVVAALSRAQAAAGRPVQVVAIVSPGEDDHPFPAMLDPRVRSATLQIPPRRYLRERRSVVEALRAAGSSVLHTHGYRPDVVDASAARGAGVRTVTTVHGFTGGGWRNRLYERLQIEAFRRMDAVVAVSDALRARLASAGVPERRLHTVPNAWAPVDEPVDRSRARARLDIADDAPRLGWVGRLSREKAPDVMLRALASMPDDRVRLSVVGGGPMRPALESLAEELGLHARVRWHGVVPAAGSLLAAFDALVLTSWTEGTPMVLLEAMAAGTPIVATSVGGVPDLVGDAALLVPPGDAQAIGRAVARTLARPQEADERAREAGRRLRESFALGPWVERYSSIYDSILAA